MSDLDSIQYLGAACARLHLQQSDPELTPHYADCNFDAALAFCLQVGKDQSAQAFLGQLDKDPEVGKMIDATSYYELEAEEYKRKGVNLTPDLWLVKLMVGAVDASFDEQD